MLRYISLVASCLTLLMAGSGAVAEQVCRFDPSSGEPNPLGGMRTFLTIKEERDLSGAIQTSVILERSSGNLPSVASAGEFVNIESTSELSFAGIKVDQVRKSMLRNPGYFYELTGDKDPKGFAKVNETLTCREVSLKEVDARLNEFYRDIMGRLNEQNKKLLKEAQRAWLLLRDNNCILEKGLAPGVKFSEPVHKACLIRMTELRTKELINIGHGVPTK